MIFLSLLIYLIWSSLGPSVQRALFHSLMAEWYSTVFMYPIFICSSAHGHLVCFKEPQCLTTPGPLSILFLLPWMLSLFLFLYLNMNIFQGTVTTVTYSVKCSLIISGHSNFLLSANPTELGSFLICAVLYSSPIYRHIAVYLHSSSQCDKMILKTVIFYMWKVQIFTHGLISVCLIYSLSQQGNFKPWICCFFPILLLSKLTFSEAVRKRGGLRRKVSFPILKFLYFSAQIVPNR